MPQDDLAPHSQPLLPGFDADVQIVAGESKCFPVDSEGVHRGDAENQKIKTQVARLHFAPVGSLSFMRRCRTISYITTAPATDTFSEGTFPSIGIETRKSHFFFTRSCSPLPSAPRTSAQSML